MTGEEPTEREREAVHSVELGLEWLRRAHGDLLGFHHKTGHAMDHLARAEAELRACGHEALAETVRAELLPSGAVDDRWTYDLVESFEAGLLDDVEEFEERTRGAVTGGRRHVAEREQERDWRARGEDGR